MPTIKHNPPELFPQYRAYSHGVEVRGDARFLFISGLNGYESDGKDAARELWKKENGVTSC